MHVWAFHTTGNNNPTGVEVRRTSKAEAEKDTLPFWPYFVIKDLFALVFILAIFAAIVGFMPNFLGHPDNYIEANPLQTPAHIVPEWYFLPFYAMLRAITFDILFINSKLGGVLAMFGSLVVLLLLPWLDTSRVRSGRYRPMFKIWFWLLVVDFFLLMWCGSQPAEQPFVIISQLGTLYWFLFFLVVMPLLGVVEKPLPQPETIEADFRAHYGPARSAARGAGSAPGRMSPGGGRAMLKSIILAGRSPRSALRAGAAVRRRSRARRHVEDHSFSFEGPFGRFDQAQLQRGLQVYTEVCSACHGLHYVPYRALAEEGGPAMTEEQMRAYAAMFEVDDPETGEFRPAHADRLLRRLDDRERPRPQPDGQGARRLPRARRARHQPDRQRHGRAGIHRLDAARLHRRGARGGGRHLYENRAFRRLDGDGPDPAADDLVAYADGTAGDRRADGARRLRIPDVGRRAEDDGAQGGRPDGGAVPGRARRAALVHQHQDLDAGKGKAP